MPAFSRRPEKKIYVYVRTPRSVFKRMEERRKVIFLKFYNVFPQHISCQITMKIAEK